MFFYFPGLGNILWATGAGSNSCKYFSRGCGLLALPQAQVHLQARVVLFAVWLYLDVDMWPAQPSLSVIRLATPFSSAGRGKTMIVFESVRKRNPAPLNFFLFEIVFQSNASFKKKKKSACSQCEFFLWVIIRTYIKLGQWFLPFPSHVCSYCISAKLFNVPHCLQVDELWQIRPV